VSFEMSTPEEPAAGDVRASRAWARDVVGAVSLAEGAIAQRIFCAVEGMRPPPANAFGDPVAFESSEDVRLLVGRCTEAAAAGERVALVAGAADLASVRGELAQIAARRFGLVVHVMARAAPPGVAASQGGMAPAFALGDLGWGMLLGAGVADAIDLALVARRAAEDSGCPFFVVHETLRAHNVEPVLAPSRALCEAFVGSSTQRGQRAQRPSVPNQALDQVTESDRAFAQRVPFALGSALRELESLTGRHHDVIERVPASDTAVALVGAGVLGESLVADVERLRASGHDVGAVRLVAWRPFPAARLVKALSRALAISVLEGVDWPLAGNPPLAGQLKAAFADALTWAPDYPGIGRIPRVVSGVVLGDREVGSADLEAIVHNLLADERGKRSFVVGGDDAHALSSRPIVPLTSQAFAMRGIAATREVACAAAELCVAVLASALGARTRVAVRELSEEEGGGVAFDLVAGRGRPRGTHTPHTVCVVAVDDAATLARGNPLARLAPGGLVAIPTSQRAADGVWAEVPPWAKALVFDRGARVIGWSPALPSDDVWTAAAAFVGIAIAAAAEDPSLREGRSIDGGVVEREVADALRTALYAGRENKDVDGVDRGARIARASFEAHIEVPRATTQREDDGVRLGRRDSRAASSAPR
jgi:pyruvate/2-oxoacid:ferredoxin oxidoreductase alpha subunit